MATPRSSTREVGVEPDGAHGGRAPDPGGGSAAGWRIGGLAALALVAALVALALTVFDDESTGQEQAATLEQVIDDPEDFMGRSVTVSGRVASTVGPGFALGEQLDEVALVTPSLNPDALPPITEGDVVQVTGTVRDYQELDLRSLYGPNFDPALFSDFEDRAVIVATGVDPTAPNGAGA
jgi:hypothetical protein